MNKLAMHKPFISNTTTGLRTPHQKSSKEDALKPNNSVEEPCSPIKVTKQRFSKTKMGLNMKNVCRSIDTNYLDSYQAMIDSQSPFKTPSLVSNRVESTVNVKRKTVRSKTKNNKAIETNNNGYNSYQYGDTLQSKKKLTAPDSSLFDPSLELFKQTGTGKTKRAGTGKGNIRKQKTIVSSNRKESKNKIKEARFTKSINLATSMTPKEIKTDSLSQLDDYGAQGRKFRGKNTKSFSSSKTSVSGMLNEKVPSRNNLVDRYMEVLTKSIKQGRDTKTIETLKLLLSHFMRKINNRSEITTVMQKVKDDPLISPSRKLNGKEVFELKSSVSISLRKKFSNRDRNKVNRAKNKLDKSKNSAHRTTRKHVPKEIEFTLNDSAENSSHIELRLPDHTEEIDRKGNYIHITKAEFDREENQFKTSKTPNEFDQERKKIEYKSYIIRKKTNEKPHFTVFSPNKSPKKYKFDTIRGSCKSDLKKKNKSVTERRPREKRRKQRKILDPVIEEQEDRKQEKGSSPQMFYNTPATEKKNTSSDALTHNAEIMEELDNLKHRLKSVFKSLSQERSPHDRVPASAVINLSAE
ncbi:unnamed protein product [Moneuplotes crassus]|uniref:Uncharacterized protein n=1 Tax=Euplotes crassus TaxID=5936 RepID=A0AAD1X5W6_EUPCR|nr:unnamed protein product [Moneuplotes crassus]